jgi:hypothetical protein
MSDKASINQAKEVVKSYIEHMPAPQKIGSLLRILPAELMMEASSVFTEKEVKLMMPFMSGPAEEPSIDAYAILNEFLDHNKLWEVLGKKLKEPHAILTAFTRWANKNPKRLGKMLKSTWEV